MFKKLVIDREWVWLMMDDQSWLMMVDHSYSWWWVMVQNGCWWLTSTGGEPQLLENLGITTEEYPTARGFCVGTSTAMEGTTSQSAGAYMILWWSKSCPRNGSLRAWSYGVVGIDHEKISGQCADTTMIPPPCLTTCKIARAWCLGPKFQGSYPYRVMFSSPDWYSIEVRCNPGAAMLHGSISWQPKGVPATVARLSFTQWVHRYS